MNAHLEDICPNCIGGFIWYCDEHDTHGNADTKDEATYMAVAHSLWFVKNGPPEDGACHVDVFAVMRIPDSPAELLP